MDIGTKKGEFYLGKKVKGGEPLFYAAKDLTTHALCVGMTGSGKTGLGITLLEEASLSKIPSLVIDPKGDLGNLLLAFPELSPDDFKPWSDTPEKTANQWKEGLAKWGEDRARIKSFKEAVDTVIYTPASQAGVPLSILSSFKAPPKEVLLDTDAVRDRVLSVTSSLLGLLGLPSDPVKSREHILIATLIDQAWQQGKDIDLPTLIQQVQKPPVDKIGALDINTFFPPKERMNLSITLNNLLASPGFKAWMEGEPLDIESLLFSPTGKPKCAILSISHLSDKERMFFVTLFLNELLTWLRRQSGTDDLRALFYMDEIFGYFPPSSMPPSKIPMLTLLKQARAFGLGIVLCTQNPVDLDYKGLANCGTWFIGKLQTERDRSRVLEGLNETSNRDLDRLIASTGNRVFLLRSVYEKEPILFETRWTLSYLRGPLTLPQIASLTKKKESSSIVQEVKQEKPLVPPDLTEFFLSSDKKAHYIPYALGIAKLHFVDAKSKVDLWKKVTLIAPFDREGKPLWDQATDDSTIEFDKSFEKGSTFAPLPADLSATSLEKSLALSVYQHQVYHGVDESKIVALKEKIRRAEERASQKKSKMWWQVTDTILSVGSTVLGVLMGKKITRGTINQAGTSMRRAGKIGKDYQDSGSAEEECKIYRQQIEDLEKNSPGIRPRKSDISIEKVAIVWKGE